MAYFNVLPKWIVIGVRASADVIDTFIVGTDGFVRIPRTVFSRTFPDIPVDMILVHQWLLRFFLFRWKRWTAVKCLHLCISSCNGNQAWDYLSSLSVFECLYFAWFVCRKNTVKCNSWYRNIFKNCICSDCDIYRTNNRAGGYSLSFSGFKYLDVNDITKCFVIFQILIRFNMLCMQEFIVHVTRYYFEKE